MMKGKIIYVAISLFLIGCAGTMNTTQYSNDTTKPEFRKAYIISAENSQYIRFKFGKVTPFGYLPPKDDPSEVNEIIGNTDTIIKQELEKYGIYAMIGKKGDLPDDFDLIVAYSDTWRWDFKEILDNLEIVFLSPEGNDVLAKSTFNIYKNKELHNFPTSKKEVPKMIKELLKKG